MEIRTNMVISSAGGEGGGLSGYKDGNGVKVRLRVRGK